VLACIFKPQRTPDCAELFQVRERARNTRAFIRFCKNKLYILAIATSKSKRAGSKICEKAPFFILYLPTVMRTTSTRKESRPNRLPPISDDPSSSSSTIITSELSAASCAWSSSAGISTTSEMLKTGEKQLQLGQRQKTTGGMKGAWGNHVRSSAAVQSAPRQACAWLV
jgi:hypothetical protein